ncbi:MAG: aldehyde dehydrogenase family protein [Candidatus Taylorbacteria bacterium]|nr:aldehyde dehydrogenase family protein [Candidatus Taylorbacteria bacterium]
MEFQGMNYIVGEWKLGFDLDKIDPSKGWVIGQFPSTATGEIDKAVDSANEAFQEWGNPSKWSWVKRAEVIDDLVQLVKADTDRIARLITLESGKHINEARAEVIEGIHMLQYCASRGRHPIGHKISSEIPEKDAETHLSPRGVCTVITPWNFPFAIPTWLIGPALVSGCPVVFKPSEETPFSGQYLVELFYQAAKKHNVPRGVLNLVHGRGDVGEYLVQHEDTVGQLFTGSYAVGSKIKQIAAAHHDKFAVCEMGGKNSLIVLKDANLELAVNAAVLSAFKTTHQRCVSADLIIVEESVEPEFTKRFLEMAGRVKFGDPFDQNVFAGPLINGKALDKYLYCQKEIVAEADPLHLGSVLYGMHTPQRGGFFLEPSIFRMKYRPNTFSLREEFFTPNVVIVPVKDFEEALFVANDTEYGLSMALITEDFRKMREFKIRGKAGLKYVNLPSIGAEIHLPFGGMRRSGTGMPSAAWLFNYLSHETSFTVNYGTEIKMAQGLSSKV